jgi:lipopolysaccharide biosynthesis glycosyltransferase
VVNVPGHYNKVQTSRYIKTSLRQTVEGDFLFIDSDTIVTDSLAEADSLTGNVMMVLDYHVSLQQRYNAKSVRRRLKATDVDWNIAMPYYNSGIMYVKDCEESRRLFEVWHEKWKNNVEIAGIHFDQIPLAYANEVTSHLITELDGVWNCQIMNNGLPFLNRAKIIHYFMSFASIRAAKPYRFHDKQLLLDIRKEGDIPAHIADMIDRAKEMFLIPNQIAAGSETALLNNSLYKLYISHPRIYSLFNTIARYILKISGSK